jgi:DNA-binding GntR family transcriptional regulator
VVRTAYTGDRRPSEYLIALYPPDRYQFLMSLTRDADAGDWQ